MNKELEALEFESPALNLGIDYGKNGDIQCVVINLYYNDINHIIYETTDKEQMEALSNIMRVENKKQQALQRLEAIDSSNPSEALECLEWIIKNYIGNDYYVYEEELITIKQTLLKAQEQEKVLEIIKKKCSSGNSNLWLVSCLPNYERYIEYIKDTTNHDHDLVRNEHNELIKEEFDTLKRWVR